MDVFDYPIITDEDDEEVSTTPQAEAPETYQRWTLVSGRSYPDVEVNECTLATDLAERYYHDKPEHLRHDLGVLVNRYGAQFINIRAIAIDTTNNEQSDVTLRINVSDDLDNLTHCIEESIAMPYLDGEKGSDNVSGKTIIWRLGWVQLITQKESRDVVTTIVGSAILFPGYKTKVIEPTNHGIAYSDSDCIFVCLNEMLNIRHKPEVVRKLLFGDRDLLSPIGIKGDLIKLAKYYECNISIHSLDAGTTGITSKDPKLSTLKLVKLGMAIGVIDSLCNNTISNDPKGIDLDAYYDFETVSNSTSTKVYAFNLIWVDGKRVSLIHSNYPVLADAIRASLRDLMTSLAPSIRSVYMHAWNGSRFDHPLLLRMCNEKFKIRFVTNNSQREVLSASIQCGGKSLILRDPCKMFPTSLEEARKLFDIEQGKLGFDHKVVEDAYLREELEPYLIANHRAIESYSMRDVEVLRDTTKAIIAMYEESGVSYHSCFTRNMASVALWRNSMSDETKSQLSTIEFGYNDTLAFTHGKVPMEEIRGQAIAGRVQAIRGEHKHVTLVDFKSMYPSVSVSEQYPCGNYHSVDDYVPHKLGLYLVKITSQNHPHVVPYRENRHDTYDWSYKGEFIKLITNVDLECLYESGEDPEILDGVIWESSTNYFAGHMTKLFELRRESEANGNTMLGEHFKHMSNSLTGATFQPLRREYVKVFSSKKEVDTYMKMYSKYVQMTHELIYENGQIMLYFIPKKMEHKHDIELQREVCKEAVTSRPILTTMFTYAYARRKLWHMWRYIEGEGIGTIVYCDTDSLAVAAAYTANDKLVNVSLRLKNHIGANMGELGVVVANADMVVVAPKLYAMRDRAGVERVRAKGIDKKSTLYMLSPGSEWIGEAIRGDSWEHLRTLHSKPLEELLTTLSYKTIGKLLKKYKVLAVYWYFTRKDGIVHKVYETKVLSAK